MADSPFKIPERARQQMEERVLDEAPAMIEYPKGSGVFAEYTPPEREVMRTLTPSEREIVHLLKPELDASFYF